jgi:excisionase family DNA binding protein
MSQIRQNTKHPRIKVIAKECKTLSPRQVAAVLGVGIARVYRMLKRGEIPAIAPEPGGKGFRIPKAALDRWLVERGGQKAG